MCAQRSEQQSQWLGVQPAALGDTGGGPACRLWVSAAAIRPDGAATISKCCAAATRMDGAAMEQPPSPSDVLSCQRRLWWLCEKGEQTTVGQQMRCDYLQG